MGKLFGTDGIRGVANEYPITPEMCVKIAVAVSQECIGYKNNAKIIIAKDTRLSGYLVEYALTAGFMSMGIEVILIGPMPTPAVSMLVRSMRADIGVMVSASHNPYQYNGIKFFDNNGEKISMQMEKRIENNLKNIINDKNEKIPHTQIGKAYRLDDVQGRYVEFLKATIDRNIRFDGLKVVVDGANGAAYKIAPMILSELGAEVIEIGMAPNGVNINDNCGAVHPELIVQEVLKNKADIGIALDGDADRLVLCDESGNIVEGDRIVALLALDWKKRGKLRNNSVVVTEMSNYALDAYLAKNDIRVYRTNVGDKFVYEKMLEVGASIGGETSGHILLPEFNKTGDGMLAALQVLSSLVTNGTKLSEISAAYSNHPKILKSIKVKNFYLLENAGLKKEISRINKDLDDSGRLFIRASGTEPIIRVLVEANDCNKLKKIIDYIETIIKDLDENYSSSYPQAEMH